MIYLIIRRKELDRLALCSFPFMLAGTLFLSPVALIRYTQPVTVSIPLILAAALYTKDADEPDAANDN